MKPGFDPNFLKTNITKPILMHDSVINILSFGTNIAQSYLAMDNCPAINLVRHVKIVVVQVGMRCMMTFVGDSTHSINSCIGGRQF